MASRRPAIIAPGGALVFTPSETADTTTSYTSPIIPLACRTGRRFIKFTLDASDNLTVLEVDKAGNTVNTIVSSTSVPINTQKTFLMPVINLRQQWDPGFVTGGLTDNTGQHGLNGDDVFTFENGNTLTNQGMGDSTTTTSTNPSRAFAGTSLEASVGAGGQVN